MSARPNAQSEPPPVRAAARASEIRESSGRTGGIDGFSPQKPKGLHWRTYTRVQIEEKLIQNSSAIGITTEWRLGLSDTDRQNFCLMLPLPRVPAPRARASAFTYSQLSAAGNGSSCVSSMRRRTTPPLQVVMLRARTCGAVCAPPLCPSSFFAPS